MQLYLNDTLAKSTASALRIRNWSVTIVDFGGSEYFSSAYNVADDVIRQFTIAPLQ